MTSTSLNRNDVFSKNGRSGSFSVVIEEKHGQVRWANHPVRPSESAGGSGSVESFLAGHSRIDQGTDLAKSAVAGAANLVRKLPRPLHWEV